MIHIYGGICEMDIDFCKYTNIGGRSNNEDSIAVFKKGSGVLCVVADGLGGHDNGEIASGIAVKTLYEQVSGGLSDETLLAALEEANRRVCEAAADSGMKTTVAALWFEAGRVLAANVGDSRIYKFSNNRIDYQSVDHSLAQLDMIAGDASYSDVRNNPDRNKLIRVVGMQNSFKADIEMLTYRKGDAFLLCSDGFWENILEKEMLECLKRAGGAKQWLSGMCGLLTPRLNGDSDNNSAIAVMIS